jgi:hypothetical protein
MTGIPIKRLHLKDWVTLCNSFFIFRDDGY